MFPCGNIIARIYIFLREMEIFDENIFEERIEIQKPVDLNIKLNKKIPIWG